MKGFYLSTYVNAGDRSAAVTIRTRPKHCLWGNSIALNAFLDGTLKHLWDRFICELEMTSIVCARSGVEQAAFDEAWDWSVCVTEEEGAPSGWANIARGACFKTRFKSSEACQILHCLLLKLHVMWSLPILFMLN